MALELKPSSVIEAKLGIDADGDVQKVFTHTCRVFMDKYVPYSGDNKQDDHLRENVTETSDTITYEMPYAHAQFVGYTTGPVVNYTTPGTTSYWDMEMATAEGDDVLATVQRYMETRGGKR